MSVHHQRRAEIITQLIAGKINGGEAAQLLGVSARQVRRLRCRFTDQGVAAVVHGNTGRAPRNRTPRALIERLRALCGAGGKYSDFNVSHLCDLLAEHEDIRLPRSTLARLLRSEGLRSTRPPRRVERRLRRERFSQEGALLQIDGSPHDWLEGRGQKMALVAAVDDATGKIVYGSFRPAEDQAGYLMMLRAIAEEYGLPEALYHDRHTILRSPREPTITDELAGRRPMSQVQAVMHELGIRSIPAMSPQAKGRIERLWRTLQDRLTKELRLAGVAARDAANEFLPAFIRRYNTRFCVAARDPAAAWRRLAPDFDTDYCFAARVERVVRRDHTIQWLGACLQLVPGSESKSLAGKRVMVHTTPEGGIRVYLERQRLAYYAVESSAQRPRAGRGPSAAVAAKELDAEAQAAARHRRVRWAFAGLPGAR